MQDELITTRAAAALLGVGTTSIKRWTDDGTLACVRTAGGHRRFLRSEVLRLLDAGSSAAVVDADGDDLAQRIPHMTGAQLDTLPFGVVQLDDVGAVLQYNSFEERFAKRRRADVLGKSFFKEVAPCTNNALLFGRFCDGVQAGDFDFATDYTFTYKMAARVVALRLFRHRETSTNWLLVRPR